MSATAINIHDWIRGLHDAVPSHIHFGSQDRCHELIEEMHYAADAGNNAELARLVKLVRWKIADEVEWEEDKLLSYADPNYTPRCCRRVAP